MYRKVETQTARKKLSFILQKDSEEALTERLMKHEKFARRGPLKNTLHTSVGGNLGSEAYQWNVEKQQSTASDMLDAIYESRSLQETMFLIDVLERLLDDSELYDDDLFRAAAKYCTFFEEATKASTKKYQEAALRRAQGEALIEAGTSATISPEMQTWHRKLMVIIEVPGSSLWARLYYFFLTIVTLTSCIVVVLETVPHYSSLVTSFEDEVHWDKLWLILDWVTAILLTLDTAARATVHILDDTIPSSMWQNALQFFSKKINIVDIVSILPTYFGFVVRAMGEVLHALVRGIRLLRILKVLRHQKPVRRMVTALSRASGAMLGPFMFLGVALVLFSSAIFFMERGTLNMEAGEVLLESPQCQSQPYGFLPQFAEFTVNTTIGNVTLQSHCPLVQTVFKSVGQALWWGVVTFITVGYGDFVPITLVGKLVASAAIVCALIFVAMPIAVVGASYTTVIDERTALKKKKRRDDSIRRDGAFAVARSEGTIARLPGEAFIDELHSHLGIDVVDMANPTDEILFLTDQCIEAAVKQLVDAHCLKTHDPIPFESLDFTGRGEKTHPLQSFRVPVWHAVVETKLPSGKLVTEKHVLSRPTVLTIGTKTNEPCSGGIGRPATMPDISIYSAELAEKMAKGSLESSFGGATTAAPISRCHGQLILTRSWGETRAMLRNSPGCPITVLRPRDGSGVGFDPRVWWSKRASDRSNVDVIPLHCRQWDSTRNATKSEEDEGIFSGERFDRKVHIPAHRKRTAPHHRLTTPKTPKQREDFNDADESENKTMEPDTSPLAWLQYVLDTEMTYFPLEHGDIVVFSPEPGGTDLAMTVGKLLSGLPQKELPMLFYLYTDNSVEVSLL